MALPVAQLGYMPNMGSPGRGPTTVIDDPWKQLAAQALQAAVVKGITNSMQQDYTGQAQQEGLAVDPAAKATAWYKKPFVGPRTDESQLGALRNDLNQQKLLAQREGGENTRSKAQLAATHQEGELTRAHQSTERNLDRVFQGQEGTADRTNRVDLTKLGLQQQTLEGQANRTNQVAMNEADHTAAMQRLDKQLAAEEHALGRKLTAEEQQIVIRSFIDQAGKMTMAAPAENMKQQILNPGSPPMDPNVQIDALAKKLQSMGYQIVPMQQ